MKKMQILIAVAIAVVGMSCTEEYSTIADRIQIFAVLNGKVLNPGDTIVINEFKTPNSYVGIRYQINGLQSGEEIEVHNRYGFNNESMMPVGEGYEIFTQQKDTFWYSIGTDHFVNIFTPEQMNTTLKFKCSDGSEKWLKYPVKLIIDSAKHAMSLELKTRAHENVPSQVTLNKGEGMFINVWMQTQDQCYLRVVSANYFNNSWESSGILPGFDSEAKLTSNVKEMYIPYENNITTRIVEVQMVGRYSSSETKTFTVNWQ